MNLCFICGLDRARIIPDDEPCQACREHDPTPLPSRRGDVGYFAEWKYYCDGIVMAPPTEEQKQWARFYDLWEDAIRYQEWLDFHDETEVCVTPLPLPLSNKEWLSNLIAESFPELSDILPL